MPLAFRCISPSCETQFEAICGDLAVGHVRRDKFPGNLYRWSWRLNVARPTSALAMHGFADDFEGAKAALAANWQRWLDLARLREVP